MARIITSGFEAPFSPFEEGWTRWAGTINTENSSWQPGGRPLRQNPGVSSAAGRGWVSGERYCYCYDSNDNLTSAFKRDFAPVTEAYGRFAWNGLGQTRVGNGRIIEWHLTGIGTICSLVELDRGSNTAIGIIPRDNGGANLGGEAPNVGVLNSQDSGWFLIEWHVKLAGSGGVLEVWVNGVLQIRFEGALAGPGGETTFDSIIIGMGGPSAGMVFNTNSRRGYDDVAMNDVAGTVNNGRVGDGVILRRVPRFPGGTTQLLSDLGAAAAQTNFRRVNRDTDPNGFVGAVTPGTKDLYRMGDAPGGGGGADGRGMPWAEGYAPAVVLQARGIQNGPSVSNIRYSLKPGVQAEIQTPAAPGISLTNQGLGVVNHQIETNPNTGEPFTHLELDDLEAGFSLEV